MYLHEDFDLDTFLKLGYMYTGVALGRWRGEGVPEFFSPLLSFRKEYANKPTNIFTLTAEKYFFDWAMSLKNIITQIFKE